MLVSSPAHPCTWLWLRGTDQSCAPRLHASVPSQSNPAGTTPQSLSEHPDGSKCHARHTCTPIFWQVCSPTSKLPEVEAGVVCIAVQTYSIGRAHGQRKGQERALSRERLCCKAHGGLCRAHVSSRTCSSTARQSCLQPANQSACSSFAACIHEHTAALMALPQCADPHLQVVGSSLQTPMCGNIVTTLHVCKGIAAVSPCELFAECVHGAWQMPSAAGRLTVGSWNTGRGLCRASAAMWRVHEAGLQGQHAGHMWRCCLQVSCRRRLHAPQQWRLSPGALLVQL